MINKKRKPDTKTKGKVNGKTKPETTQSEPVQEEKVTQPAKEEVTSKTTPTPIPTPVTDVKSSTTTEQPPKLTPLTMAKLQAGIDKLWERIQALNTQMTDVQSQLLLKRKPTNNSKCQIRDKVTGKLYKSKNSVYQSMLKAGELKELVDKGIFGKEPLKNTFGVYALIRAYPDRFEEVHEPEKTE
jgi:putative protein kinase ArgK-like GTPase of G3E family